MLHAPYVMDNEPQEQVTHQISCHVQHQAVCHMDNLSPLGRPRHGPRGLLAAPTPWLDETRRTQQQQSDEKSRLLFQSDPGHRPTQEISREAAAILCPEAIARGGPLAHWATTDYGLLLSQQLLTVHVPLTRVWGLTIMQYVPSALSSGRHEQAAHQDSMQAQPLNVCCIDNGTCPGRHRRGSRNQS